jgi:signal peptidase I
VLIRFITLLGSIVMAVTVGCSDDGDVVLRFAEAGHSMAPAIADDQEVEVLDYAGRQPTRGDIVVFVAPTALSDRVFTKRIIGLPGDAVEIDAIRGGVSINGSRLDEPYVLGVTSCAEFCEWTVPPTNANLTLDYEPNQRPREHLSNEEEERSACERTGCYFVLGDNRQNSSDSRQGWLLPSENILGWVDVK